MEADKAIFQDLEGFGEDEFFKMAMESFGFLFCEALKYHKMTLTLSRS